MALLWMDSFDVVNGIATRYESSGGTTTSETQSPGARTGSRWAHQSSGSNAFLRKAFAARASYIQGCAMRRGSNVSAAGKVMELLDGTTSQVYLQLNTNHTLSVVRGDGTVLGTTAAAALVATNTWYYVEWKVTIDNVAGSYEVKVDGTTVLSGTDVDTQNTANASATNVSLGWSGSGTGIGWDDYYIADPSGSQNNNFLTGLKVEPLLPNGNGSSSGWTGSDGDSTDNYLLVDDPASAAPDGDATYVAASAAGTTDTYAFGNLSAATGTVAGVLATVRARRDDTAARSIAIVTRPGSTDHAGSDISMTPSYANTMQLQETNPDTANPWTITEVNASEFGVKVTL